MPTMKNRKHLSSAEMKKAAKHFKKEHRQEQEEPKPMFSKGGHVKKHEHKHEHKGYSEHLERHKTRKEKTSHRKYCR